MSFSKAWTGAVLLASAYATVAWGQTGGEAASSKPAAPGTMSQGKYVALAADCMSCHTAPGGKPYAGGDPLKSAFGTIYGPNITQDKATGIGSWSKEEFEQALRRGIRKDGAYLYPAMPYGSYTKMSQSDMDALWKYMKSIAPVANTVPKNTLPFPLTIRSGMAVWQSLYFEPGPFQPNSAKTLAWNRGAYLVEALGHCGDCHTPRNVAQGLEQEHRLTGATIEGWYAPDISNDPLSTVSKWRTEQLAAYLKTGVAPGNVKTFGPMQEVVHDSLGHLSSGDLTALATYLKDQPQDATSRRASKVKLPAERLAFGKQLYDDNCSSCHQNDGKGVKGTAPALAGNDGVTASEPYNVIMAMLEGFPPQDSWGAMASFAKTLSDDQIADVANYVRTAWGNSAAPNATPWSVANWRRSAEAPQDESKALLCPTLPQDVMKPALDLGPGTLNLAASNQTKMQVAVGSYLTARPKSSTAEVIEGMSTAYCRTLAQQKVSEARMSAAIAAFAQHVALAARSRGAAT